MKIYRVNKKGMYYGFYISGVPGRSHGGTFRYKKPISRKLSAFWFTKK